MKDRFRAAAFGSGWRPKLKSLDVEHQRAIQRSIAEGRAVDDPRDAALAIDVIDGLESLGVVRHGWGELLLQALLLAALALTVYALEVPRLLALIALGPLAFFIVIGVVLRPILARSGGRIRERQQRARAANLALLEDSE